MGAGASTNIKNVVTELVDGKPEDASDIKDLTTAKNEISKFRKLAKGFLSDDERRPLDKEGTSVNMRNHKNRAAVMDKRDNETINSANYIPKVIAKSDKVKDLLLDVVTKNILFTSYTKDEHTAIIDAFESVTYHAGDYVIRQGAKGNDFFIVENGYLDIYVNKKSDHEGGENKVRMQLGPGASFGELALMYNTPRAASIKAAVDCVLWRIDRQEYRSVIIHYKFLRNKTYLELIQNVEVMGKRLGSFLCQDDLEKLAVSMEREIFQPDEVILRQGNKGNNFYIIIEGEVDVYKSKLLPTKSSKTANGSEMKKSKSGKDIEASIVRIKDTQGRTILDHNTTDNYSDNVNEEKVATLKSGQFFGEKALLKEDVRQASCVAKSLVTCLTLGREDFIDMIGTLDDAEVKNHISKSFAMTTATNMGFMNNIIANDQKNNNNTLLNSSSTPVISNSTSTITTSATITEESNSATNTPAKTASTANATKGSSGGGGVSGGLTMSALQIKRILGRGGFGHVKLAFLPHSSGVNLNGTNSNNNVSNTTKEGQYFAIKCQLKSAIVENGLKGHVLNEMHLMLKINHTFIARLYSALQDDYYLYFVLELLPGGELFSYLQTVGKLTENDAKFYVGAIVSAFTHIHQSHLRIAYRDLKPENIVLTAKGYPKLVDFGLAKQVLSGKTWTMCGTPDYLAPEVILNQGHDIAVDYWTLGILITEIVAGRTPFQGESSMEIYEKILNSHPKLPASFSKNISDLVLKLLKSEQGKRLGNARDGIAAIISHKWFNNFNWKKLESEEMTAPYVPKMKTIDDMSNFDEYDEDEDVTQDGPCSWFSDLD